MSTPDSEAEGTKRKANAVTVLLNLPRAAAIVCIRVYQKTAPFRPPMCRYQPSCSAYAITAIQRYGAARGGWMALKRIGRCHPWGGQGYDPVPERIETK